MRLFAKVTPENLEAIMQGRKGIEYRQFESITLINSESGETVTWDVKHVNELADRYADDVKKENPGVPWEDDLPVHEIVLGRLADQFDFITHMGERLMWILSRGYTEAFVVRCRYCGVIFTPLNSEPKEVVRHRCSCPNHPRKGAVQ